MIEKLTIEIGLEPYRHGLEDGFAPRGCTINPPKKPYLDTSFGRQWIEPDDYIVSTPFGRIVRTQKQIEALQVHAANH